MTRTILLVDDEPDCLTPMEVLLREQYTMITASSGEEALKLLETNKVDIVIADQRMPNMTGVELLARIKVSYPKIVRVVLTAYMDFEAMIKAINEGAVYRYIIKPWDVDDMRLVIKQALEFKDLRELNGELASELAEAHHELAKRHRDLERAHWDLAEKHKKLAKAYTAIRNQSAEDE